MRVLHPRIEVQLRQFRGLYQLRARDVVGYTFVVFLVLVPVVLIVVALVGTTLTYPL